ncbi:MAG: molybdenum cofactor guanylyltransferase MobA [Sulfurovum sp.]
MRYTTPLVILAGGKSSRMGNDKALLPFGGYSSLSEFQYQKFFPLFEKVYISCKNNKFDFDFEIIEDRYEDSSPLVALISIFETLSVEKIFLLSVDAPFVDKDTIERLFEVSNDSDIVVAKSPNGIEPLCGIYNSSILKIAKNQLSQNNHRLNDLLKLSNTHFVEFESEDVFLNMNYIEDYEKAKQKPT